LSPRAAPKAMSVTAATTALKETKRPNHPPRRLPGSQVPAPSMEDKMAPVNRTHTDGSLGGPQTMGHQRTFCWLRGS
jgi:hypothetical protein